MKEATKKPATKAPPSASKEAPQEAKKATTKAKEADAHEKDVPKDASKKDAPKKKATVKAKPDGQPPSAFSKPLTPSKELAAVVGADPLPRTEVVSKVWVYIKEHNLQNEANKREIVADDKLKAVFGRDKVTMFEMNKYLAQHLK